MLLGYAGLPNVMETRDIGMQPRVYGMIMEPIRAHHAQVGGTDKQGSL